MCKVPVTFGGGSMIVYGSPLPVGLKQPLASQWAYHRVSKDCGSKLFSMTVRLVARRGAGRWKGNSEGQILANQRFGRDPDAPVGAGMTATNCWAGAAGGRAHERTY